MTDIPDEEETEEKDDSPATEEPKEENKDETDENEEDVKESDVLAKVTRPIKEEEEKIEDDEEGSVDLGTIAKVGAVGLGALALSSVFLAEDEEPFAFNADTDYSDIYGADEEHTPIGEMTIEQAEKEMGKISDVLSSPRYGGRRLYGELMRKRAKLAK